MQQLFSTQTVAELTGASVRQIDYWARTGLVRPSARDASGRGSRRRYTFLDVVALLAVTKLREQKCPLQKIRAVVRHLQQHDPLRSGAEQLAKLALLTDGKRVYMLTDERRVMDVVTRQHVWSVALGLLIRQAQEEIRKLPAEWTEVVQVRGRTFHLVITRDDEDGGFIVQCRELPGALEQGETAEEAVTNGKDAIAAVLAVMERRQGGTRKRHVAAG